MGIKEDIARLIADAGKAIGKPLVEGVDFYIIHQPLKHKPLPLPKGKIAVYTFYYKGQFLKIGQANANSSPRYQSQHYHTSGRSTLAKSLINDPSMKGIDPTNVAQWIMDNCERFDVIIDASKHDKLTLNFIEGLLHYYYRPKYED